jgi:hypothetical protein
MFSAHKDVHLWQHAHYKWCMAKLAAKQIVKKKKTQNTTTTTKSTSRKVNGEIIQILQSHHIVCAVASFLYNFDASFQPFLILQRLVGFVHSWKKKKTIYIYV